MTTNDSSTDPRIITTQQTQAQAYRRQHIAKVQADLKRLARAVSELKANTDSLPDWRWTGDWQSLAQHLNEVTQQAENAASQSQP